MADQEQLRLIKLGSTRWNQWRSQNPGIRVDLSGSNLRGLNLRGADLHEADLHHCDIRSTNFSGADLTGADLSHTQSGLRWQWIIILLLGSAIASGFSGLLSGFAGALPQIFFSADYPGIDRVAWLSVGAVVVFLVSISILGLRRSIIAGFSSIVVAFIAVFAASIPVAASLLVVVGTLLVCATSFSASGLIFGPTGFSLSILFTVPWWLVGSYVGAVGASQAITIGFPESPPITPEEALQLTGGGATLIWLTAIYVGWRVWSQDKRYGLLRRIAVTYASVGGTRFTSAALEGASFTDAQLKGANLIDVNLAHVSWLNVSKLEEARLNDPALKNELIRNLVLTGKGSEKNYDRFDLRNLNLEGFDLSGSSMLRANLCGASLRRADLSGAFLVGTQFDHSDLREAVLTASCIQDWGITKKTHLYGIYCDYVFMRFIDGKKRDQMPPRGNFNSGDFVKFISAILETIDIYHDKDINPRLALSVLSRLSRDYDDSLEIVAVGRVDDRPVIRVKVPENIDKERLKENYYSMYEQDKRLPPSNIPSYLPFYSDIESKLEAISQDINYRPNVNVTHIEYNIESLIAGRDAFLGGGNVVDNKGSVNIGSGSNVTGVAASGGDQSITDSVIGQAEGSVNINSVSTSAHAQVAREIGKVMELLSKLYSTRNEDEKICHAKDAIQQKAKDDPGFRQRLLSAIAEGSNELVSILSQNPFVRVPVAVIKGWIQS